MKSTRLFPFGGSKKLRPGPRPNRRPHSGKGRAPRRRWACSEVEQLESRQMMAIDLPAVLTIDTSGNGQLEVPEIEALSQSLDSGTYIFARLANGQTEVRFAPNPVGVLEINETLVTLDFRGAASGIKWDDLNGNGVRENGEPGVAGVRIYADLNSDREFSENEPSTLTAPDGTYRLLLPPGVFVIREVTPAGTVQTFPLGGGGGGGGGQFLLFAGEAPTDGQAAAAVNPWHNAFRPADVNGDGRISVHDALNLVGELRATGRRVLGGEGEAGAARPLYVDVNGDLLMNVQDLLGVVSALRAEGEAVPEDDSVPAQSNSTDNELDVLDNDTGTGRLTITGLGTVETGIVANPVADQGGQISIQPGVGQENDVVLYTPQPDFYGIERFIYEVTDETGSAAQAEVTVNVTPDRDYIKFTYQVFQTDGVTPASSVEIGQEFILRTFIKDDRNKSTLPPSQRGVFSAYMDLAYDEGRLDLVTNPPASNPHGFTRDVRFGPDYQDFVSVDGFLPGLIDEAGATQTDGFELNTQPLGPNPVRFFDARFRATAVGAASFTGNAPDDPTHQEVFFRPSNLEPLDPNFVDFGQLNLTITPPIGAVADSFTRNEDLDGPPGPDGDRNDPILDLLANDNPFVAGQPLRIVSLGAGNATTIETAEGGQVEIVNGGLEVRYTPPADSVGSDSFTYRVSDGTRSETAVVTVNLLPINDAPTATDDTYSADNMAVLTVEIPGVLANDFDVDGDPITVTTFQAVSDLGAQVTVNPLGRFTYNPTTSPELVNIAAGEIRIDSFTYSISDVNGETSTATVRVFVSRNTGGAHIVEILAGRETPNINFGNTRLNAEGELEAAISAMANDQNR